MGRYEVCTEEEPVILPEKQVFPKTDLGRSRSCAFFVAFIYAKNGTEMITGSLDKIEEHTKRWHTCHGMIRGYKHGVAYPPSFKIFGRHASWQSKMHFTMSHKKRSIQKDRKRNYWDILIWVNKEPHIYTRYRKIPERYLNLEAMTNIYLQRIINESKERST